MTEDQDHIPDPPFEAGDTFVDPLSDQEWTITGVTRSYNLEITSGDGEEADEAPATAQYPERSVVEKLEIGDLVVHPENGPTNPDRPAGHECDTCGETFPSGQALAGHQSAHADQD